MNSDICMIVYKHTSVLWIIIQRVLICVHMILGLSRKALISRLVIDCGGTETAAYLKGLAQAKIIKNRWFYFGFLIWPYDVNMYID